MIDRLTEDEKKWLRHFRLTIIKKNEALSEELRELLHERYKMKYGSSNPSKNEMIENIRQSQAIAEGLASNREFLRVLEEKYSTMVEW